MALDSPTRHRWNRTESNVDLSTYGQRPFYAATTNLTFHTKQPRDMNFKQVERGSGNISSSGFEMVDPLPDRADFSTSGGMPSPGIVYSKLKLPVRTGSKVNLGHGSPSKKEDLYTTSTGAIHSGHTGGALSGRHDRTRWVRNASKVPLIDPTEMPAPWVGTSASTYHAPPVELLLKASPQLRWGPSGNKARNKPVRDTISLTDGSGDSPRGQLEVTPRDRTAAVGQRARVGEGYVSHNMTAYTNPGGAVYKVGASTTRERGAVRFKSDPVLWDPKEASKPQVEKNASAAAAEEAAAMANLGSPRPLTALMQDSSPRYTARPQTGGMMMAGHMGIGHGGIDDESYLPEDPQRTGERSADLNSSMPFPQRFKWERTGSKVEFKNVNHEWAMPHSLATHTAELKADPNVITAGKSLGITPSRFHSTIDLSRPASLDVKVAAPASHSNTTHKAPELPQPVKLPVRTASDVPMKFGGPPGGSELFLTTNELQHTKPMRANYEMHVQMGKTRYLSNVKLI